MYSRADVAHMRHAFWTTFGQYLAPQPSAAGTRINWINYKTGEKHIHFKLQADTKAAFIGIELSHPDATIRQLYFEQLEQFKNLLHKQVAEAWTWQLHATTESGQVVSFVFTTCNGVNIMHREDWSRLISFFKPRIVALDAFWNDVHYAFEALR